MEGHEDPYIVAGNSMPGMDMAAGIGSLSNTASFPFGFPSAGSYRVIVQMKHGVTVDNAPRPGNQNGAISVSIARVMPT